MTQDFPKIAFDVNVDNREPKKSDANLGVTFSVPISQ